MQKKIAVLSGDGIGPEVMEQAVRVLKAIEKKFGHHFQLVEKLVGGAAIDCCDKPLPEDTLKTCEHSDAILFGSVGGPKWDHLPSEQRPEVGALLPLRKHFDLFANIRPAGVEKVLRDLSPIKNDILGEGFDCVVVRELTGDAYFGKKTGDNNTFGCDEMKYTRPEIERISRVAFSLARRRRKKVTNIDKSNVLVSSKFWRMVVEEIHEKEFPEIELDHLYIDNAAMQVLIHPQRFDVLLTGNLFGDILSDELAQISGSIGMQGSASINSQGFGLYEPMGGSAPDIAGKGIANPIAQIVCVAMMLETSFALLEEAKIIRKALSTALFEGLRTSDIFREGATRVGTDEMGRYIEEKILHG
jgi:3-isopropylmalate dehydrogenase